MGECAAGLPTDGSCGLHEGHAGPARAIAVTSDLVVSGGDDAIIRRWTADGAPLGEPLAGHESAVVSLDVSPRGEIASVAGDGTLRVWTPASTSNGVPTLRASTRFQQAHPPNRKAFANELKYDVTWGWQHAVAFAPSGGMLGGALFDGAVRLWNADGSLRAETLDAHSQRQVGGRFLPRATSWPRPALMERCAQELDGFAARHPDRRAPEDRLLGQHVRRWAPPRYGRRR
jgi:WD40 repeat protein